MSITRTTLTDDSGAGTDGTVLNQAWMTTVYDALDGRWSENSTTSTGNQDNFAYSEADVLRCNNATTITLRGLLAPASPVKPGKRLIVVSVGAGSVVLNDQDANSTAANRIITGAAAALTLAAGTGYAWLEYDSVTARWRVVGSSALIGATTLTAHGVLIGEGTSAVVATAAGTTGQALRSGGASADPLYGEVIQTTTLTGTQSDFALTAGCHLLRCNNASLLTLTGLAAGYDGQRVVIVSIGAGQVDLAHQGGAGVLSTAANRLINFATSAATSLAAGVGTAEIEYDATTARWRLIAHDQGAWITPTYAGGDYTAATGTWTVDSGDVLTMRYWLKGRSLHVKMWLLTTSVSATPTGLLRVIPGVFTAAGNDAAQLIQVSNAGAAAAVGIVQANGTSMTFNSSIGGAGWSVATNNTVINATAVIEVT